LFLKVTRTGGFAGLMANGELDTSDQPDTERLEEVVHGLDQSRLGSGQPRPDRYIYRLEVRDDATAEPPRLTVTVAEQDLDETTAWLLDRVLQS
jgi:hypothetical protein